MKNFTNNVHLTTLGQQNMFNNLINNRISMHLSGKYAYTNNFNIGKRVCINIAPPFGMTIQDEDLKYKEYGPASSPKKSWDRFITNWVIDKHLVENEVGWIYVIECNGIFKVGITGDPKNRFKAYKTECPFRFDVVFSCKINGYKSLENGLHQFFSSKNNNREWFDLSSHDLFLIKGLSRLRVPGSNFIKNNEYV